MFENENHYRNKQRVQGLSSDISALADKIIKHDSKRGPLQIMEICGGHTHSIYRYGIDQLLPDSIEFVHGPGCPVCVLPPEAIDTAIELASGIERDEHKSHERILVSFGDALKVSGSRTNLLQAKASGADVRIIYAPFDALTLAQQNPNKQIIFFAIGFDTTMPSIAHTIAQAHKLGLTNIWFLCYHIRLLPTLEALFSEQAGVNLDGLIGPGHVSMVIGSNAYQDFVERYQIPMVVAGFEPVDVLQAIYQVLQQIDSGRTEVENAYARVVSAEGSPAALAILNQVFEFNQPASWRGLGAITNSGVKLRAEYQKYDAFNLIPTSSCLSQADETILDPITEPEYCREVLTGRLRPNHCPLYKKTCTPSTPKGALMVSTEGACSAYFQYKQDSQ